MAALVLTAWKVAMAMTPILWMMTGDTVTETNALAAGGIDLVKSSALDFTLGSNVENLTLTDNISVNGGTAVD